MHDRPTAERIARAPKRACSMNYYVAFISCLSHRMSETLQTQLRQAIPRDAAKLPVWRLSRTMGEL